MKRLALCASALLAAAAGVGPAAAESGQWIRGEVTVKDTHIFEVDGRTIRLHGVDAPVKDQRCAPGAAEEADCGHLFRFSVTQLFNGKRVQCRVTHLMFDFRDEPVAATCFHGSTDVNATLVAAGIGLADRSETHRYVPYERSARDEGLGIWNEELVTIPRAWAYKTHGWQYPFGPD